MEACCKASSGGSPAPAVRRRQTPSGSSGSRWRFIILALGRRITTSHILAENRGWRKDGWRERCGRQQTDRGQGDRQSGDRQSEDKGTDSQRTRGQTVRGQGDRQSEDKATDGQRTRGQTVRGQGDRQSEDKGTDSQRTRGQTVRGQGDRRFWRQMPEPEKPDPPPAGGAETAELRVQTSAEAPAQSHSESRGRLQPTPGSDRDAKPGYDGLTEGRLTIYIHADNSSEDCSSVSLKCLTGCRPAVGVMSGRDHDDLIFEEGELLGADRSEVHQRLDALLVRPAAGNLGDTEGTQGGRYLEDTGRTLPGGHREDVTWRTQGGRYLEDVTWSPKAHLTGYLFLILHRQDEVQWN
ncbi:hypothetical protein EYF80_045941 [Liparis tanakae]|uniref:Uncharacterized protein n=1 Tax=Liparis tanakae TaxID=230148 RepID=A0A4Z2FRH1_9TELE|nr:hypothetical protein EYF80_045941 [Liparis tanakae]